MPINDELFGAAAVRGDVSYIAVKTAIALDAIADALAKISNGKPIEDELKTIRDKTQDLDKIFDELTGWTSDGS